MDDPGESLTAANAGGAAQREERRDEADAAAQAASEKAIVLFSDGTGNSSAKLFKTNVWRMYEAVDLGPSPPRNRLQIAFYDNGVGTSALRPLAMLGSVFGVGLKQNVLDIYRYACRNYRPGDGQDVGPNPKRLGDQLYGFGFSRGGFTMRVAMAMIAEVGLVDSRDESDLDAKSLEAYRHFRRKFKRRKLQSLARLARSIGARFGIRGRAAEPEVPAYDTNRNYHPVIRFMGIWDTVSAYGGPIVEITRAIDNWIYPLSMPDYELSRRVDVARHALAIDDARDAFQPLLWDEVAERKYVEEAAAEQRKACLAALEARQGGDRAAVRVQLAAAAACGAEKRRRQQRLQQVWFSGMHADVGGGYPDESLSFVSFLWILEEAEKAGLRPLKVIVDRYRALANSASPIHDSRQGVGSYYRFQPRNIEAWIEKPPASTLTLQDPEIRDDHGKPRGLLCSVQVHESVISRIAYGTDRYAPIALPPEFRILRPQRKGENIPQAYTVAPGGSQPPPPAPAGPYFPLDYPLVETATRKLLTSPDVVERRRAAAGDIWHRVWLRRLTYFGTVLLTLILVFYPAFVQATADESKWFGALGDFCSDDRCVLPWLISLLKIFVPEFLEGWIDVAAAHAAKFLAILFLLFLLRAWGTRIERRLRDRSYRLWQAALGRKAWPKDPPAGFFRRLHEHRRYQRSLRFVKWQALPTLTAAAIGAALIYMLVVLFTRATLFIAEPRSAYCAPSDSEMLVRAQIEYDTDEPCRPLGIRLAGRTTYRVTFELPRAGAGGPIRGWTDRREPKRPADAPPDWIGGDPRGLSGRQFGLLGHLGVPLRRVMGARYLQPIVEIRRPHRIFGPLGFAALHVTELDMQPTDHPALFEATFTVPEGVSGEAYIFANDVAPIGLPLAYRNNIGRARVTISLADEAQTPAK
jgi:uncharacterized protein (DUF2235 family)